MVDRVIEIVRRWPVFAEKAGVANVRVTKIQASQRTNLYVVGELLNSPDTTNQVVEVGTKPWICLVQLVYQRKVATKSGNSCSKIRYHRSPPFPRFDKYHRVFDYGISDF